MSKEISHGKYILSDIYKFGQILKKMKEISFTNVSSQYGWLSTMAPYPVEYEGTLWKTTYALFQALRFNDEEIRKALSIDNNPMECKNRVKAIIKELTKKNELWKRNVQPQSPQDIENMDFCIRLKLKQHPELLENLLKTAQYTLYEDVTKRGRKGSNLFWGAMKLDDGSWEGENVLGKIWMKIREEEIEKWKVFTPAEKAAKFGLAEDPYKKFKEALELDFEIFELDYNTMQWDFNPNPDFSKPPRCYKIHDS